MHLTLSLLGKPSILVDSHPAPSVGTSKAQAILYYLAITGTVHTRSDLATLLWPKDTPEKAKNSLRVALVSLRKVLAEHLIVDRKTVAFNEQSNVDIDVHQFDQTGAAFIGDPSSLDVDQLIATIELHKGDFLEDFHVDGAHAFEDWVLQEREHRRQLLNQLLEIAAGHLLEQRRYGEAREILSRQLELAPWEEKIHLALMETLSRLGDFNGALAQYQICVNTLDQELDAEPEPETTALFQRIQAARSIKRDNLPPEPTPFIGRQRELTKLHTMLTAPDCRLVTITGLGGMGKTRLALAAARQVYKEAALFFLNGVVYSSVSAVRSGALLPSALAEGLGITLSGSEEPLTRVIDYLENKELLLVLDGFETLVQDSERRRSNMVEQPDSEQPDSEQPDSEQLDSERTDDGRMNSELLVGSSDYPFQEDSAVDTINLILEDCPYVRCLITSREPLGLKVERKFELYGLDYPPDVTTPMAESYSAIKLFLQGATQVRPTYRIDGEEKPHVIELCRILGGMPLGIKLSAAWLRAMSTQRIVAEISRNLDFLSTRMRDIDPRQRSMRAVLDHAWELLLPEERTALSGLAIFAREFSESAAMEITGIQSAVLKAIAGKSLIQLEAPRVSLARRSRHVYPEYGANKQTTALQKNGQEVHYTMHQMVHQYGIEKLQKDRSLFEQMVAAHVSYYVTFLEEQATLFNRMEEIVAIEAIGQETDNIRLAWIRSVDNFNPAALTAILKGISLYYRSAGPFHEAEAVCRVVSEQLGRRIESGHVAKQEAMPLLGQILVEHARFLNLMGRHDPVLAVTERVIALGQELDSLALVAPAQLFRVRPIFFRGEVDLAYEEAQKSLALAQEAALPDVELECWNMIGFINLQQNNYAQARISYEKSLAISTEIQDRHAASTILSSLGVIAVQQSDYEYARIRYEDALNLSVEIGDRAGECHRLNNLARVYSEQRFYVRATAHLDHALHIAREIGHRLVESNTLLSIGRNALYVGDYETAESRFAESLAIKLDMQDAHGEGEVLTYQGLLLHLQGQHRAAVQRVQAGLERAREAKSEFVINFAHTNMGHALVQLNRFNEAKHAYRQALIGRQKLGHLNLSTEPLAGLIDIALRQSDEDSLHQHGETLVSHLLSKEDVGPVYGTDQPFRVYWMGYQALLHTDPDRALEFLQTIQDLLGETLANFDDPDLAASFRENVDVHMSILNA